MMHELDIIAAIKADAKAMSVNPNALAASGLKITIDQPDFYPVFGENAFTRVAAHRYAAIVRALAEQHGFEVADIVEDEPILLRPREVA